MRSRRIKIEGGRYLIFYTFEDEPGLGPAASGGATGRPNEQQGGAPAAARTGVANDESYRVADGEPDPTTARRPQVSSDEQPVAGANPPAEGRDV